jgi:hypothetical protein
MTRIKPLQLPNRAKIRPITPEEARFENSTVGEKFMFDLIAQEHTRRSGTSFDYFHMDRDLTWVGPYPVVGHLEWPDPRPESREEGYRTTHIASAWIARQEFEGVSLEWPKRGDVVRLWKIP